MPWKEATIMSQKELFIKEALKKKKPFKALCTEFKISRETGYQLLHRYEKEGLKGLKPKSRAPHNKPFKTCIKIEEEIIKIRVKYPSWGGRKIYTYLTTAGLKNLPAPSTISDVLKRHGYISHEESLKRQALGRFEREHANELWQMDFKGKFPLKTKESCFPLTILDDHSRFSVCIKACGNERYITVKERLIEVFEQYGLPKQFNVDNGNPWGHSQLVQHTQLTVWLMRLGIKVSHSRPRHPQTNGKLERFHRTLKKDVLSYQIITDFEHAQSLFDEWRYIYNYERPHQAINMLVPANRYQPSKRSMPIALAPIEYNDDALVRRVRGNGRISFKGNEYLVGEAFASNDVELKLDPLGEKFKIYFDQFKIHTYNLKN